MDNHGFTAQMSQKIKDEKALETFLRELGPSESVGRFLRGFGNVWTRCSYAGHLVLYLSAHAASVGCSFTGFKS